MSNILLRSPRFSNAKDEFGLVAYISMENHGLVKRNVIELFPPKNSSAVKTSQEDQLKRLSTQRQELLVKCPGS